MLCIEYPTSVTQGILSLLDKRDDENCDFDEFLHAVKTIFLYDSFFEEMDSIFKHIDNGKTGSVRAVDLVSAMKKLRSSEIAGMHELRVPDPVDFERIYKALENVTLAGSLTHGEYLTVMFRTTTDDY